MKNLNNLLKAGLIAITLSGCKGTCNDVKQRGGLIGTYAGDFIVIRQNGGDIMDVWKLNEVYVQSETNSDGWRFDDDKGNIIQIGGDAKVIRMTSKNSDLWEKYHEYHSEFESKTYREKYNSVK